MSGTFTTFAEPKDQYFCQEKREKEIFSQTSRRRPYELWLPITPREKGGAQEQVDILDISGGKQLKRNLEKQRNWQ